MSTDITFATARRQTRAELHATWLEGGSLTVYSAADLALVTFTLPATITPTDGVITIGPITEMIADTGLAAYAQTFDDASGLIADYPVGVTGSGNAVELNSLSLVQGGYVTLTSFLLTEA
jgi:hypothetical protein